MRLRRLTLTRRSDRKTYLDRWGIDTRWGGIYLHHITAPDPGRDLHDHPWWFASIILRGGYEEIIQDVRDRTQERPYFRYRRWAAGTVHAVRLDQCHQISRVQPGGAWTVILRGPRVRLWGFYTPDGWVEHSSPVAVLRRDVDEEGRAA